MYYITYFQPLLLHCLNHWLNIEQVLNLLPCNVVLMSLLLPSIVDNSKMILISLCVWTPLFFMVLARLGEMFGCPLTFDLVLDQYW